MQKTLFHKYSLLDAKNIVSQVLSFRCKKQTSKNVADTTFKPPPMPPLQKK